MTKLRYFIIPRRERWTIRCARRRIGLFGDPADAAVRALEVASIEEVRGHLVEVLQQDAEGRWLSIGHRKSETLGGLLAAPVHPFG